MIRGYLDVHVESTPMGNPKKYHGFAARAAKGTPNCPLK